MAVSYGDYIYMTAGRTNSGTGFASDVWRSKDGAEWEQLEDAFPARAYHTMVVLKDCMYVMGGQTFTEFRNDVW